MEATQILMSEHRVIERVITAMDAAAGRLANHQGMPAEFFLTAADFITGFADGCHHKKEEGVLFASMVKHGLSPQQGPVAVMLAEHEQGRTYTRGLRQAALRYQAGDLSVRQEMIDNVRGYSSLLRQHIQKEDRILFPMADRVIPAEHHDQILAGFEHVEHEETGEGVHEKYLAMAESLERQME
jgi:hemerythrin-like domain-containing protein